MAKIKKEPKVKTIKITPEQETQGNEVMSYYGLATFSALVRYAINKIYRELPAK